MIYLSSCCHEKAEDGLGGYFCTKCNELCKPYKVHDCRGCETIECDERFDAHGITTGYWCEECYNSSKYPYRKDKYPTIEHDGYGERLNDDY